MYSSSLARKEEAAKDRQGAAYGDLNNFDQIGDTPG